MNCCPLYGGHGERASFSRTQTVKAAREHECGECDETIPCGARYERTEGLWNGRWSTFKTCLSCVEIRDHFACEDGWMFGEVWRQIEENFYPDMKAGGPCMEGLSPAVKARLFERRMKWLEYKDQNKWSKQC